MCQSDRVNIVVGLQRLMAFMRFISPILLVSVVFFAACTGGNHRFTVVGNVKNLPEKEAVLLQELGVDDKIIAVDSGHTDDKGHFELGGDATRPGLYQLTFGKEKYILLSIDKGTVKIDADWDHMENYKVSGSAASSSLQTFVKVVSSHMNDLRTLDLVKSQLKAQGKDSLLQSAAVDEANISNDLTHFVEKYADTTTFLPNALFAVRLLNPAVEGPYLMAFAGSVERRFPNMPQAKEFADRFKKLANMMQNQQNTRQSTGPSVGNLAPEIALPDVTGNTVKLSSFKGKYVLVDFWASWCGPCRMENPNVVAAYNKFKDKGFTVLGVSLDDSKDKWQEAVQKDHLTWTHVSDLKRWESVAARDYGVEAIPANFLLDKDGKIIGHDLKGQELEAKLAEVLK